MAGNKNLCRTTERSLGRIIVNKRLGRYPGRVGSMVGVRYLAISGLSLVKYHS